ncbi:hypothetical protein [Actinoplanes philippinensis]|uniref:hypothetical protein n=1 Tax=Actinoplanes philippinensis TaxID=35752 RepID=UPI003411473D
MTGETEEDRAFAAVRDRVESGEYLDSMPGVPGEDLEGGGAFGYAPDGRLVRTHHRWEPGFRESRAAGRIPPLPPLEPATAEAVITCEAAIGMRLPRLLRRCYLELGDGGFGPGYGLVPVAGLAFGLRRPGWPVGFPPEARDLLEICDWGCGIASFVDPHDPAGRMWAVDPNPPPEGELAAALFRQNMDLASWLLRWAEGRLQQPWLVRDPDTGEWREATTAEYEDLD